MSKEAFKETSKDGIEKPRLDLIPFDSIFKVAEVFTYGAHKVKRLTGEEGSNNWRSGKSWTTIIASVLRHIGAWSLGQDLDPESGKPHLAHAAFWILALLNYSDTCPQFDDRIKLWK